MNRRRSKLLGGSYATYKPKGLDSDEDSIYSEDINRMEIIDSIDEKYDTLTRNNVYIDEDDLDSLIEDFTMYNNIEAFERYIIDKLYKVININNARTQNIEQFERDIYIIEKFIRNDFVNNLSSNDYDSILQRSIDYKLNKKYIDAIKEAKTITFLAKNYRKQATKRKFDDMSPKKRKGKRKEIDLLINKIVSLLKTDF